MRTGNFGAGWDFPMQSGRELLCRNCLPLPVQVYICEAHQKKRSVCSGAYFVVGKMYLPGGGIVLRRKRVGILLCVQMSGDMVRQKVYQRYAVVDKNILWYSGINFLGSDKAAHGAMRLCSAELAKELMDRVDGEQETQLVLEGV